MKKVIISVIAIVLCAGSALAAAAFFPKKHQRNSNNDVPYQGEWFDKRTAREDQSALTQDFIITEIYSDCFFAKYVFAMPYELKINGTLPEQWCVGDQIHCTCDHVFRDTASNRIEADLVTAEESTFQLNPNACYKPVIYLYPAQTTEVTVKLMLDGDLTCTYPSYQNGWTVTASPDGTLSDGRQTYNYLYWEGITDAQYDFSTGFCVKGSDTAAFLENALDKLGLNRKEANEFIVYWLEKMQNNPYNVISFQTNAYTDAARLDVSPQPDTVIRVFMTWYPSDTAIAIPEQRLTAPERNGFTVVEWGGTRVS